MSSNRFPVWQQGLCLFISSSLVGCGSGTATAPTTPVGAPTTVSMPGAMAPTPGMPGGAGMPGAGHAPPGMPGGSPMAGAHGPGSGPPMNGASVASMTPNPAMMGQMAGHAAPGSPQAAGHMANRPGGPGGPSATPPLGSGADHAAAMARNSAQGGTPPNPGSAPLGYTGGAPGTPGGAPGAAPTTAPIGYTGTAPGIQGGAAGAPPVGYTGTAPGLGHAGALGAAGAAPAGMPPGAGHAGAPGAAGARGPMGAAGMMPGQPGGMMPGQPGGAGGSGSTFPEGSIDDTLQRFCMALADGDTAAASEFVSPKATGMVGQIREGSLSEEKVEEISDAINPISDLQPNSKQKNNKRVLRNKKNQVLSFTLKKDKDDDTYKITEFSVSKPKK